MLPWFQLDYKSGILTSLLTETSDVFTVIMRSNLLLLLQLFLIVCLFILYAGRTSGQPMSSQQRRSPVLSLIESK